MQTTSERVKIKVYPARKKKQVSIRLEEDILEHADKLAAEASGDEEGSVTRSDIINQALRAVIFRIDINKVTL